MSLFAGCGGNSNGLREHTDYFTLSDFVKIFYLAIKSGIESFFSGIWHTITSPFISIFNGIVDIFRFLR